MQRFRMKKCVFVLSLAGAVCLLAPAAARAATPNGRPIHTPPAAHASVRKAPKPPKRDQVHRGGLDGSLTLIQFISTRRSHDERHRDQDAPPDSAAQVRASWDDAEREHPATVTARSVDSLPPHWGAMHLCI
jgi:hypothetical protein